MKILPTLLLVLVTGISLRAEDAPKRPPAAGAVRGQGAEKMKEMMLQRFDANKNGTLDPDEKAVMMKAMQDRKGGAAKSATPGAAGKGDPKAGERGKAMLLQKFDTNKNGVLDPDEREAAMKAMQDRKGKAGGISGAGVPGNESGGSKFRRPPEAPKAGAPK